MNRQWTAHRKALEKIIREHVKATGGRVIPRVLAGEVTRATQAWLSGTMREMQNQLKVISQLTERAKEHNMAKKPK